MRKPYHSTVTDGVTEHLAWIGVGRRVSREEILETGDLICRRDEGDAVDQRD